MDIAQAHQFLEQFANYEKSLDWSYPEAIKLDRMRSLAKELGNPHNAYPSILVAGSKGKGSVAALTASILRMEGYKVGLYTSPHLSDLRERIRVNGLMISQERLIELSLRLRRVLDEPAWKRNPPTYFEVLTAMAMLHFKESKIQIAVLEVGLGGLYDSTNIAHACSVGLVPIGLEHTDKLGKTIPKIAVQKCGVIKGRETVVSAPQTTGAEGVIQKAAEEADAVLWRVGREIRVTERGYDARSQRFDVKTPLGDHYGLETQLLGRHQIENAALAVGLAVSIEKRTRMKVSAEAVRQGVAVAAWPGRLETVAESPAVLLDGAHTPDSVRRLLEAIDRHFTYGKLWVVLGISADKDALSIGRTLGERADGLFLTAASGPRAMPAAELAAALETDPSRDKIRGRGTPEEAIDLALFAADPKDLVLVTGSLFLVGQLRSRWIPDGA